MKIKFITFVYTNKVHTNESQIQQNFDSQPKFRASIS